MSRFNPLKIIKPMFEDPAQRRASFVVVMSLIPLIIILGVLLFPVFKWLHKLMAR